MARRNSSQEQGLDLAHGYDSVGEFCLDEGMLLEVSVDSMRGFPTPYNITTTVQEPGTRRKPTILRTKILTPDYDEHDDETKILEREIANYKKSNRQISEERAKATIHPTSVRPLPEMVDELTDGQVTELLRSLRYEPGKIEEIKDTLYRRERQANAQANEGIYQTANVLAFLEERREYSPLKMPLPVVRSAVRTLFEEREYTPAELTMPEEITYDEVRQLREKMHIPSPSPYNHEKANESYPAERVVNFLAAKGLNMSRNAIRAKIHDVLMPTPEPVVEEPQETIVPLPESEQLRSLAGARGGDVEKIHLKEEPARIQPALFEFNDQTGETKPLKD